MILALCRISSRRTRYRAYTSFSVRVGNLEIELFVARIGLGLADVERHARGAEHGAGDAQIQHVFERDEADALRADASRSDSSRADSSYSSTLLGNWRMNLPTAFCQPRGGSSASAAEADVAGHHALAGEHFEDAQNVFALAEAVEEHAHRADVERVRSQPDQVAVQPRRARSASRAVHCACGGISICSSFSTVSAYTRLFERFAR